MHHSEKTYLRMRFELEIYRRSGNSFENFFSQIMMKHNSGFRPVKPHGNLGDRKNDGFVSSSGVYYQVYSPENPGERKGAALNKAIKDFQGLYDYWQKISPIKEYHFVLNDKYDGVYPDLERGLADIKKEYNLNEAAPFYAKHLEEICFSLEDDRLFSILGFPPDPSNIPTLEFFELRDVIQHILDNVESIDLKNRLSPPDFDGKIEFNNLSKYPANLLVTASYQLGTLDNYFSKGNALQKQTIGEILKEKYIFLSNLDYPVSNNFTKSDAIFDELLKIMAPNKEKRVQDACLVIMAKYFEACDIFEDPENEK